MSSNDEVSPIQFRQLFDREASMYTYLVGCSDTGEAVIIDPVLRQIERDIRLIKELDLHLVYALNTHIHAGHVTGTGTLKKYFPQCKSVLSEHSGAKADVYVDQDDELTFGKQYFQCRFTPGHTDGCITYVFHDHEMAFPGDAILIRSSGRTDLNRGNTKTTVLEEKKFNPRFNQSREEFVEFMNSLNMSLPEFLDKTVSANLYCGILCD